MPNYWNVYQTELKRRIRNEYNESKAEKTWKESKKYATMNELDILKKSDDIYIDIAYKVRKAEGKNLISEKRRKREKVNNSDNEWNKFYYDYKDKNPDADLKEVTEAYKGNIKKVLRISEEDRLKKNKIQIEMLKEEKKHIPEFRDSIVSLSTSIIQRDFQLGGFGSVKDTIRDGLKDLDKTCDDIYNEMVECYIESTRTKISQKTGLIEKTDNNYLIVNKKIFLYVTDNNLFESMITREIIPKSEERIGTLVKNAKHFLVIYKDFYKIKDSSNEKSLVIKILKIFIHLGILGYGFKETPIIEDFFTNGKNVYYFNLNNLKEESLQNLQGNLFQNQDEFVEFRNANASIFSQGYSADKNYYKFEYYHEDPDPNKFAKFRNIIKDTTKELNSPTRISYTPMYITGAILAALAVVGINDIYRSITKKPNEFSKS
tara:strand:- start:1244 stop:2539 length:1296 start_codon:yes stop_codon:yes gene_type:complete